MVLLVLALFFVPVFLPVVLLYLAFFLMSVVLLLFIIGSPL